MLSLVSYGPHRRLLRYPEIPLGCNVAFDRRVFERYGNFRLDLGRKGGSLIGHEEREFLKRLMTAGGNVVYEPRAYVFHAVSRWEESRVGKECVSQCRSRVWRVY